MSVIARWAVMLTTCVRPNEVAAWIIVANAAASATGRSRSVRRAPITSSISTLVVVGSTSPASRLTSISTSPTPR
jgi:hypothetical protein